MNNEELKRVFGETLNKQGHSFAQAVIARAEELYEKRQSSWIFEAAEFPVEVQSRADVKGRTTRIDFILQHERQPILMLAECKRANTSLNNWIFVCVPYISRNDDWDRQVLILECPDRQNRTRTLRLTKHDLFAYHLAIEVKSGEKGDSMGGRSDVFEEACGQVMLHINGYVNALIKIPSLTSTHQKQALFPVIFTTARLYKSNVDLRRTNVENGEVDVSGTELESVDWILYRYHYGPALKHSMFTDAYSHKSIGEAMEEEYVRTIAVVSASGIPSFLTWASKVDYHIK